MLRNLLGLSAASTTKLLYYTVTIFAGTFPLYNATRKSLSEVMTAVSWGGICGFIGALQQPTCSPESLAVVFVRSGHIMHDKRRYTAVFDHPVTNAPTDSPRALWRAYNEIDEPFDSTLSRSEIRAVVSERPGAENITFSYQVRVMNMKNREQEPLQPLYLPPGAITREILGLYGIIVCPQDSKEYLRIKPVLACQAIPQGMRFGADRPATTQNTSGSGLEFN